MDKIEVVSFATPKPWGQWLQKHHASSTGVWLRMYKKASGKPTVTYAQALDEALCYGWIDGQMRSFDADSYIQRFTPRSKRSIWSKINTGHIARLIKEKRIKPAGLAAVAAAKKDGRWQKAYSGQSQAKVPKDFLRELNKHPKAKAFYKTLNKTNLYAIYFRLAGAKKPETRARRLESILARLNQGQKFHD